MITQKEIKDFCLQLPFSYIDFPFGEDWTLFRHQANKKTFAALFERGGILGLNLKCDPYEADFLRHTYGYITPAYHMNKTHWNTIALVSEASWELVQGLIEDSYHLICPKPRKFGVIGNQI